MHTLTVDPRLPKAWLRCQIVFLRHGTRSAITRYEIKTENPRRVNRAIVVAEVDGAAIATGVARIARLGDSRIHRLRVELG